MPKLPKKCNLKSFVSVKVSKSKELKISSKVNKENIVSKILGTGQSLSKNRMKVCKNHSNQHKSKLELPLKLEFMNNPVTKPYQHNNTSRSKQRELKPQK